ncbi:glutathione transferase GstA [Xylophilus rhododendri]|uniref:Glutathione transferase GstA n=1 Tax=Xylophilus rhododendri TaxID=2697032 RepID=A0A857J7X5_9BURK|nr:glutathione transferase GstA [Xylophilus rhododendri]QHI98885.1 glutathione transferase GstA [Xylophilus rhododendri]
MKLYFSPGACSLSPHIVLHEAGLAHEAIPAPTKTHKLPDGTDYYSINPLGYVPLLELDDGTRLREAAVIVQYIADLAPQKNLIPAHGTMARYRMLEWLNFIATELHKGFGPLFNPNAPEEFKQAAKLKLKSRLTWLDSQLEGRDYLAGDSFSVADAYLFTMLTWAQRMALDINGLERVNGFFSRTAARPAVKAALAMEQQQQQQQQQQ